MATTFVEAMGTYLQSNSYGTLGTNLFIGLLPGNPDACIAVYEANDGMAPLETAGASATAVDVIGLQVVIRVGRDDYATGRDKAIAIRSLLGAITEQTLSGVRVLRVQPASWAAPSGNDESDRPHFSLRFRAYVGV